MVCPRPAGLAAVMILKLVSSASATLPLLMKKPGAVLCSGMVTTLPQKPSSTLTFICTDDWPASSQGTQTLTCVGLTKSIYPGTLIPAEGTSKLTLVKSICSGRLPSVGELVELAESYC